MSLAFWILLLVVVSFGFVVFRGAPYVPSKKNDLRQALSELYPISKADTLVDIGSGDGVVLREAARRGATAVGYELNPLLVVLSRWLSRKYPAITIHLADYWRTPLPKTTTVVYTFGESRDIGRMASMVADTASRVGHPILFISYGVTVPGYVPVKQLGAHHLYRMEPLQSDRA